MKRPSQLLSRASPKPRTPLNRRAIWEAVRVNIFAVSLLAIWTTLNAVLLPDRVSELVGSSLQASALGLVSLLGVGIATLVQPVAGRLSDESRLPDRRRPFILAGSTVAILCFALFWDADDFVWLFVAFVLIQIALNVAQAAFQALIPDVIPPAEHGLASGVKSALSVAGVALGLLGTALLVHTRGGDGAAILFLATVLAAGAALTAIWVPRVPPLPRADGRGPRLAPHELWATFARPLARHPAFARVVLATFFFMLGVLPLQRFLLYYLKDRFCIADPVSRGAVYLALAVLVATLAALAAGFLSDRLGRAWVLRASVALVVVGDLGMAFAPSIVIAGAAGALVALGVGAFVSVSWALFSDLIPAGSGAQYYGIANFASAGASALVGLFGPVLDLTRRVAPDDAYRIAFSLAALVVLMSLVPLRRLARSAEGDAAETQ